MCTIIVFSNPWMFTTSVNKYVKCLVCFTWTQKYTLYLQPSSHICWYCWWSCKQASILKKQHLIINVSFHNICVDWLFQFYWRICINERKHIIVLMTWCINLPLYNIVVILCNEFYSRWMSFTYRNINHIYRVSQM